MHLASATENDSVALTSRQRGGKADPNLEKFRFVHFQVFGTAVIVLAQPPSSPELRLSNRFSQRSGKLIDKMTSCKNGSKNKTKQKMGQEEASGMAQGLMLNQLQNRERKLLGLSLYSRSRSHSLRSRPTKSNIFFFLILESAPSSQS